MSLPLQLLLVSLTPGGPLTPIMITTNPPNQVAQHDETMNCIVCGGVCKPTDYSALRVFRYFAADICLEWMHPYLIKGPDSDSQDNQVKLVRVVYFQGGAAGFVLQGGSHATVDTSDRNMYLPIHKPCFEIAEAFCRYQANDDAHFRNGNDPVPTKLADMYKIWLERAVATNTGLPGPLNGAVEEPTDYGNMPLLPDLLSYAESHLRSSTLRPTYHLNPGFNPWHSGLVVFRHLQLLPNNVRPSLEHAVVWAHVGKLPAELYNKIADFLAPLEDLEPGQMTCCRLLPPSWWMHKLFNGDMIPWLYDLRERQTRTIANTFRNRYPNPRTFDVENHLDWEFLCRQLGSRDVFGQTGILSGRKALENRRRIWRVLDSARPGRTA